MGLVDGGREMRRFDTVTAGRTVLAVVIALACAMAVRAWPGAQTAHAAGLPGTVVASVVGDPDTPVSGNPLGSVTVAEFFDYRCPYCRMMQPTLAALVAKDKRVRLVSKEWPIFGGISIYAARVALAAQWQGKYAAVHKALFSLPRSMDEASVKAAAQAAGVDLGRLAADMASRSAELDAMLSRTAAEAHVIGFQGTPGFVVGNIPVPGALTAEDLQKVVDQAAPR